VWGLVALFIHVRPAAAQHATVTTPFHSTSDSFYEQIGVGFNVTGHNFFFQQNGFGQAAPQFGGFAPGAGATTGFNLHGHGVNASFNIEASQGSRAGSLSQAPSVTMPNGVQGGFFDTTQNPFVVSVTPVVGDANFVSSLRERIERLKQGGEPASPRAASNSKTLNTAAPDRPSLGAPGEVGAAHQSHLSSPAADRPADMSVADIRRLRAARHAVQDDEVQRLVDRAQTAEADGKPAVAKIYYQQAARLASGELRADLLHRAAGSKSPAATPPARSLNNRP